MRNICSRRGVFNVFSLVVPKLKCRLLYSCARGNRRRHGSYRARRATIRRNEATSRVQEIPRTTRSALCFVRLHQDRLAHTARVFFLGLNLGPDLAEYVQ